jgi:hypothetical protein
MGAILSFFELLITDPVKLVDYLLLGGGGIAVSISVIKAAISGSFTDYFTLGIGVLAIFLGFVGIENLENFKTVIDHSYDFVQVYWVPLSVLGAGLSGLYLQSFLNPGVVEQAVSYGSIALVFVGVAYLIYLIIKGPDAEQMPDYFEGFRKDISDDELLSLKQVQDTCIKEACDDKFLQMGVDLCTIDPSSEEGLEYFKLKEKRVPRADANMCRRRILEGRILCYKDKERATKAGINCTRLVPFKIPDLPS